MKKIKKFKTFSIHWNREIRREQRAKRKKDDEFISLLNVYEAALTDLGRIDEKLRKAAEIIKAQAEQIEIVQAELKFLTNVKEKVDVPERKIIV